MKCYTLFNFPSPDHHGDTAGQADTGRHRGQARRHHKAGELHTGAARYVHGYGHVGREPGNVF